jgi:hypothetical protein
VKTNKKVYSFAGIGVSDVICMTVEVAEDGERHGMGRNTYQVAELIKNLFPLLAAIQVCKGRR